MKDHFDGLPVKTGAFWLPDEKNSAVWPVVACDQYTAEKEVWQQAYETVGEQPSSLKLILPEAYLDESDSRIPVIRAEMEKYLSDGTLSERVNGAVLCERTVSGKTRTGLMLTLDLEAYSYEKNTFPLIRPTEGTVTERIPPRLKVREGAPLELSHILILIDDPGDTVMGPLKAKKDSLRLLYSQQLMLNGGRITGRAVEDEESLAELSAAFRALKEKLPENGILLAVGDGNHSLATAKAHWEKIKAGLTKEEQQNHPARFASAEITNIWDDALVFEPIHRVVFGAGKNEVLRILCEALPERVTDADASDLTLCDEGADERYVFRRPLHTLPVGTVQLLLDRAGAKLDYIHGENAVRETVKKQENACGILLSAMPKQQLFPSVSRDGPLPRKTFSMGEANEKRYYMEARKIK